MTLFSSEIDFTYCAKSVNEVKLSHLCFSYVVVAFSLVIKMKLFLSVIVRIPLYVFNHWIKPTIIQLFVLSTWVNSQNLNTPFVGKPKTLGLGCCKRIRVSASSLMLDFQSDGVGIYEATGGKQNNRLVYKHTDSKFFKKLKV